MRSMLIRLLSKIRRTRTLPLSSKYQRSNQDTCLNQRPIAKIGDQVISGQVLADGSVCEGGEQR